MPTFQSPALVLKAHETGDSSQVIHALTATHGTISLYGKGLQQAKSRFRALLQPLALVEVQFTLKDGGDLASLRDVCPILDHSALALDLERLALAYVLAEAASAFCHAHSDAHETLDALLRALHALAPEGSASPSVIAVNGLLEILRLHGAPPQLAPEILAPWPAGQTKPRAFWLQLHTGLIHLRGSQPAEALILPLAETIPAESPQFPLTPGIVRFLFDRQRGLGTGLSTEEAVHLLEGVIRFSEAQAERRLRSADFWRGLLK